MLQLIEWVLLVSKHNGQAKWTNPTQKQIVIHLVICCNKLTNLYSLYWSSKTDWVILQVEKRIARFQNTKVEDYEFNHPINRWWYMWAINADQYVAVTLELVSCHINSRNVTTRNTVTSFKHKRKQNYMDFKQNDSCIINYLNVLAIVYSFN